MAPRLNVQDFACYLNKFASGNPEANCDFSTTFPILNVDTYEHSYFIDYGSDRKAYLDALMRTINWSEVNRRLAAAMQMTMARK